MKSFINRGLLVTLALIMCITALGGCTNRRNRYSGQLAKPAIYLYPEEDTEVNIQLDLDGKLGFTYPEYSDSGWTVMAQTDGTLIDGNNNEYNYIFWEAESEPGFEIDEGTCVKGDNTVEFLESTLRNYGLSDTEVAEFIVYWGPQMQDNEYNVIKFVTDEYCDRAKLNVTPAPDTVIRIYMAWYGSDSYVDIPQQELPTTPQSRDGFVLVEWGGGEATVKY